MRQSFKIWQVCSALWSPQAFLVMSQLIKGRQLTRNPFRDNSGNILLLLSSQHEDFTSLFSRVLHDSFIFFFSRSTQTSGFFHLLIKLLCDDNFFHNLHYRWNNILPVHQRGYSALHPKQLHFKISVFWTEILGKHPLQYFRGSEDLKIPWVLALRMFKDTGIHTRKQQLRGRKGM